MSLRWNLTPYKDGTNPRQKVVFTPELLTSIGASGKTLTEVAKELRVSKQLISRHINKNQTNRDAYDKGKEKLKICQPTH